MRNFLAQKPVESDVLLKQIFKSLGGVQKRIAFERVHSPRYRFTDVRCDTNGEPDRSPFDHGRALRNGYTYRIERTLKNRGE